MVKLLSRSGWPGVKRTGPPLIGKLLAIFFSELPSKFLPLGRRHVPPLFTHGLPSLRRQGSEPLAGIANGFPLLRRQLTKPLKPLTELLLLVRRQLAPFLEPLPRLLTFLLAHVGPLACPVQQSLLPVRRNLIPMITESVKNFLFLLVQLLPGNALAFCLRRYGACRY